MFAICLRKHLRTVRWVWTILLTKLFLKQFRRDTRDTSKVFRMVSEERSRKLDTKDNIVFLLLDVLSSNKTTVFKVA